MQRRNTKKRPGNRKKIRGPSRPKEMVNRSMNFISPRLRTKLTFNKFINLGLASGVPFLSIYFQPTYAYDVDPVVGSDAMAGFYELGKLYTKYRVNSYTIVSNFCNNEQFAVEALILPSNTTFSGSGLTPQTMLANPRCRRTLLGTYAQFPKKLRDRVTVSDFGGSANRQMADQYTGATAGGAPANNLFHTVAIWADSSTFNAGVTIDTSVTVDIEFFELATPTL